MDNLDAGTVGQLAVKLGLTPPEQLTECLEEAGIGKDGEPLALVRAMERKGILTPWQSSKLLKGDQDGYFLGGYRLLYKIASGSFGRVFRGDNPRTGEVVAVKVLRRRWSENPHTIELFEREGKVGMGLRHPNIVSILDLGKDRASQQFYIVMEFVEGGNLRELLSIRKTLEPAEGLRILEDAANGLAYAYARGVSHRDMKLTNVLVTTQGTAKLVDFGLAGVYAGAEREVEQLDRTVDYAGLERATGAPEGDIRTDIYFLGCVFYEMLTGVTPIVTTRDKYQRMQKERFLNVRPLAPGEVTGPPLLFHLIETMMAFNPKDRYQTPAQLLEGIRAVRRAVEGHKNGSAATAERSVFIVEKDERLRDVMRDKLKAKGYRVFAAADPGFARDRFKQRPFNGLVVDARTVGEDGLTLFQYIMAEAERQKLDCGGLLIVPRDQPDWAERVRQGPNVAVFVGSPTLGELYSKIKELVPRG